MTDDTTLDLNRAEEEYIGSKRFELRPLMERWSIGNHFRNGWIARDAEVRRLREAISNAPHSDSCVSYQRPWTDDRCDCWQAGLLAGNDTVESPEISPKEQLLRSIESLGPDPRLQAIIDKHRAEG